jgi:hypothetical protein
MKYNERGIRDFKCRFCGENIENKNPCSNSYLDDVRHNFDFRKSIRVDVQDSESSGSVIQVLRVSSYFNDLCSFYH